MAINSGEVKFYNTTKAFGFIVDARTGQDIFFHTSGVSKNYEPKQGDQVSYETMQGKKGLNAVNVRKI